MCCIHGFQQAYTFVCLISLQVRWSHSGMCTLEITWSANLTGILQTIVVCSLILSYPTQWGFDGNLNFNVWSLVVYLLPINVPLLKLHIKKGTCLLQASSKTHLTSNCLLLIKAVSCASIWICQLKHLWFLTLPGF